jgi:hypothetical protein
MTLRKEGTGGNNGLLQAGGVCVIESVWFFITFITRDSAQVFNARLQQAKR